jgi:hypothetical protein
MAMAMTLMGMRLEVWLMSPLEKTEIAERHLSSRAATVANITRACSLLPQGELVLKTNPIEIFLRKLRLDMTIAML